MRPPTAFAAKGPDVEEWADRRFFRPLGYRLTRRLEATRVTADQVTVASLVLGLLAGHLMFYRSAWLNIAGVVLFVLSDVLDSADGQLARVRGTATRTGRILDGASDNLRFINLYIHLLARLVRAGAGWGGVALVIAAAFSQSLQAAAADFVRNVYLTLGLGRTGEVDLPEHVAVEGSGWATLGARLYRDYTRRQVRLFPRTAALLRLYHGATPDVALRSAWQRRQRRVLSRCAWIAQNIRFVLLAVTAPLGWPAGYFWITIGPLNAVLVWVVASHERRAGDLLSPDADRSEGLAHA